VNDDVVYPSKRSYYDLLAEVGITWKQSQQVNPKTEKKQDLKVDRSQLA